MRRVAASLIVVGALMALDQGSAYAAPPPASGTTGGEARSEASVRFERGKHLYKEGEHKLALIEFTRAYELSPSYPILYNIGQVNLQLGFHARAVETLERYLADGGSAISAERRQQVLDDIEIARGRTARLLVQTSVAGAEVTVDDIVIGTTPMPQAGSLVDAGQHRVSLTKTGYLAATTTVTLAGGDERTIRLALGSIAERRVIVQQELREPSRLPATIGWITTGTLIAGTVVTGLFAASAQDRLDELRRFPGVTRAELDAQTSRARSLSIATDILGAASIVAGGVSVWLTLKPPRPASPNNNSASSGEVHIGWNKTF